MKINKHILYVFLAISAPLSITAAIAQVGTCVGDQVNVYCHECETEELDSDQCTTRVESTPEARWCCCEADYPLAQCANLFDALFGGNRCDGSASSRSNKMMSTARTFRDNVLQNSPLGRKYSDLYYKNTESLTGLLLKNPGLLENTTKLLTRSQKLMTNLSAGKKVTIEQKQMQQVYKLLRQYADAAGKESDLGMAVHEIYSDLKDESVLARFGITVAE